MTRLPSVGNWALLRNVASFKQVQLRASLPATPTSCCSLPYHYNSHCALNFPQNTKREYSHSSSWLSEKTTRDVTGTSGTSGIAAEPSSKACSVQPSKTPDNPNRVGQDPSIAETPEKCLFRNPPPLQTPKPEINIGSSLHKLVERTVSHGLLPTTTATYTDHQWTVTISLDEVALHAKGTAATRDLAEANAIQQFERLLESSDALTSRPPTGITLQTAPDILQNYCTVVLNTTEPSSAPPIVWGDSESGYHAQLYAAGKPLSRPASAATKEACVTINSLSMAHKITSGHSDFWPVGFENPFQARILVDKKTDVKLRQIIALARKVLAASTSTVQAKDVESYLNRRLASLPFPSSISKMLSLGIITHCLDATIIFAALDSPVFEETTFEPIDKPAYVTERDHLSWVDTFRRLRQVAQPSHLPLKYKPDTCHDPLTMYRLDTIRAIDTVAKSIESALAATGLLHQPSAFHREPLYNYLPNTKFRVHIEPYGSTFHSHHSPTNTGVARRLLTLGLGANMARYSYETLIPFRDPVLYTATAQRVRHATNLSPRTLRKRLLSVGPLAVVSGIAGRGGGVEGGEESVRCASQVSPLSAVLFGAKVAVPEQAAGAEFAELRVNDWLPVLIKADARDRTHEQARELVLEAREVLHKAIDKALVDFYRHGLKHRTFFDLLCSLPMGTTHQKANAEE